MVFFCFLVEGEAFREAYTLTRKAWSHNDLPTVEDARLYPVIGHDVSVLRAFPSRRTIGEIP